MTSTTLLPLHFATHLFTLTVAIAAAYVFARRTGRSRVARGAGTLGFLVLAAEQVLHGAAVLTDTSPAGAFLRSAGYVLILGAALTARGGSLASLGVMGPGSVVAPAAAALAAGIGLAWRSGRDRSQIAMASGLLMIGAGESFLALDGQSGSVVLAHGVRTLGWTMVAAGVMSATRRSIRFRFVASFVAVLLVVVLAVSSTLTQVISDNLRREAVKSVSDETQALADRFAPRALDAAQRAIATATNLAEAIGNGPQQLQAILELINRTALRDLDFLLIVNPGGTVVAKTGLRQKVTDAEAQAIAQSDPALEAREQHRLTASVDALGEKEVLVIAADPLNQKGALLIVGYRVDDALLEFLAPATQAFLVQGDHPTASTLESLGDGASLPPRLLQRIHSETVVRGEEFTDSVSIGGVQYFVSVLPMERTDGVIIGALVGAQPAEVLEATQQGVNRVLFLVTLGAVAVAILLSSLFGRRFTRPVRQLTSAARRVQAGDLSTKAEVTGEDEVGDLAIAFNRMTASLSSTTESLQHAVDEESRLRDQLETVLNSMGDGLIAVDEHGKVVTINPAAERIAGLSRKAVGRPIGEVLVGRAADGKLVSKENPSGQVLLRRKGTDVPVAISSAPIKGGRDELLGRVFVIRDRSREAEVERVKREFLATVSHELRTPLTPIVGYAELLTRREFDMARVEEFARGILSSARRMERIVGMLLDYSAIEAGRMPVEPEAVALRPLVTRAVEEWRERAPGHAFATHFSAAPAALIDVPLFRRTMDELLDNAVKYSPDGGTITVSVRSNGRIHGKAAVQVEVADQGIGIPANQLPGIFQDFLQLDGSDTRAFGGLGLGLAFVKRIVQAHRGTINAESKPGVGTTFKVGFPAAEEVNRGT
jgi:two-component system sensor histidine kinase VicK